MQISFTEKKNIRKSFGKLKESLSIPNLIEVQKNSYKELTEFNSIETELTKGFDRVFKSIFPIEDLNDKATLEYVSYRLEKPIDIYKKLRVTNPSPFMFYFNFSDFQIIGASPEILVRLRDNKITVRPIAGTRPRGKTLREDRFYEKDLLNDKKELSEHLMLLDLGRNDAGKVSKIDTVKVTESFIIEKYSHVMHIVSNVIGEYNKKFSKFKSLLAGFPAGTVSGAPKIRAMEIIDELETTKRKVYAGGIGYFSANGEFDTCIALRTAVAKKDKFYVQAGAGIVADSKPLKEYEETVNKAKALINALK